MIAVVPQPFARDQTYWLQVMEPPVARGVDPPASWSLVSA